MVDQKESTAAAPHQHFVRSTWPVSLSHDVQDPGVSQELLIVHPRLLVGDPEGGQGFSWRGASRARWRCGLGQGWGLHSEGNFFK